MQGLLCECDICLGIYLHASGGGLIEAILSAIACGEMQGFGSHASKTRECTKNIFKPGIRMALSFSENLILDRDLGICYSYTLNRLALICTFRCFVLAVYGGGVSSQCLSIFTVD